MSCPILELFKVKIQLNLCKYMYQLKYNADHSSFQENTNGTWKLSQWFILQLNPLQSLLMSPDTSSVDCEMLSDEGGKEEKKEESDEKEKSDEKERVKRSEKNPASGHQPNATAPNIDILINPSQKKKREEYVGLVMNKLRDFFKDKNSTLIYPNLFRLLW